MKGDPIEPVERWTDVAEVKAKIADLMSCSTNAVSVEVEDPALGGVCVKIEVHS